MVLVGFTGAVEALWVGPVCVCVCLHLYQRNSCGRGILVWVSGRALGEPFSVLNLGLLSPDGLVLKLGGEGSRWTLFPPHLGYQGSAPHPRPQVWGAQASLAFRELTFWPRCN